MDRESKEVLFNKYGSNGDTRESAIPSELSWFARWAESSQDHGPSTKQPTDENEHQGANDVGNDDMGKDPTAICAYEDGLLQKEKKKVVEVMPRLFWPNEMKIYDHGRAKNLDKLCDLVTRVLNAKSVPLSIQKIRVPEPLGVLDSHSTDDPCKASTSSYMQPPVSSFSVSHFKVGQLETLSRSCDDAEKAFGFADDPLESCSHEANDICIGSHLVSQEKPKALTERDGQVEDPVHPGEEMLRVVEYKFTFGSRLGKALSDVSSDDPANQMLVPFQCTPSILRPLIFDEDFVMQPTSRETYEKLFTALPSFHFENKCFHYLDSFTFPDNARKVNLVESADCESDGRNPHSSTYAKGGRQFVQNSSFLKFSQGTNKQTSLTANFEQITAKNVEASLLHWTETTYHFPIRRKTSLTYCNEDQPTKVLWSCIARHKKALRGIAGPFPSFHDHDKASMGKPFNKVSKPDSLKEYMHDACYISDNTTEMGKSYKQATFSSQTLRAINDIGMPTGGTRSSFEESLVILTLEGNNHYKNTGKVAGEVHYLVGTNAFQVPSESTDIELLDLNIVQPGNSVTDMSCGAHLTDLLDSQTPYEPLPRTISPFKGECVSLNGIAVNKRKVGESRRESLGKEGQCSHEDLHLPGKPDSDHRWVKRLKLSDLEAVSTKRSIVNDSIVENKRIRLFSKVLNYSRYNSTSDTQSNTRKQTEHHSRLLLVERVTFPRQINSSPGRIGESKDMLSNPWIQRWCSRRHVQSIPMSSACVTFEPEGMQVSVIEMQAKEFPSLGAMALMGKALTNFRRCELMKRGPLVLWKE